MDIYQNGLNMQQQIKIESLELVKRQCRWDFGSISGEIRNERKMKSKTNSLFMLH